jgi:hypothetical protein
MIRVCFLQGKACKEHFAQVGGSDACALGTRIVRFCRRRKMRSSLKSKRRG